MQELLPYDGKYKDEIPDIQVTLIMGDIPLSIRDIKVSAFSFLN